MFIATPPAVSQMGRNLGVQQGRVSTLCTGELPGHAKRQAAGRSSDMGLSLIVLSTSSQTQKGKLYGPSCMKFRKIQTDLEGQKTAWCMHVVLPDE